jgi:hypothetical protein
MHPLCATGHLSLRRDIVIADRALAAALRSGRIVRVRRGVLACDHADELEVQAAASGGAVTCTSVLATHGVWVAGSTGFHIQVPPTASRVGHQGTVHWGRPRFGMETPWRASRLQSLWQAMHCLDEENALAAIESAIRLGFVDAAEVRMLVAHAPDRLRPWLRHLCHTSQSGNETVVRVRLQRVGYRVVSQGAVPGMGHEDLVIEDCVGLDVDGRRWHGEDRFVIDRDRDLRVEGLGRSALRIAAPHIWDSWPSTLAVIDRVVADALRERQRRTGRSLG